MCIRDRAILHKLAKERKEHRDTICCAAAQGLTSQEESTQSKIVKLIQTYGAVSYTHLRAHETRHDLVCRLLLEKKKKTTTKNKKKKTSYQKK